MSGGHFDNKESVLIEIAEEMEKIEPKLGKILEIVYDLIKEIDYYLSGDSSLELYKKRKQKILTLLKKEVCE